VAEVLRKIDRAIHKVLLFVANISLVAMVLILTYTVVLRYVFNTGLAWAEEVPRLMVTVFVFLSCAIGVRDHLHMTVNVVYNFLPKGGRGRWALEKLGEVCMLLCGVFMFYTGGHRVLRMMKMPGVLPMTGLPNWVQYVAVPIAGAVIIYDCILFLTGVLKPGDLLYGEPEVDYVDQIIQERKEQHLKEGHA